MTDNMMNLRSLLEKALDADVLREMIGFPTGKNLPPSGNDFPHGSGVRSGGGPGPVKRRDHGQRHTAGGIDHCYGNGSGPARSSSGRFEDSRVEHV